MEQVPVEKQPFERVSVMVFVLLRLWGREARGNPGQEHRTLRETRTESLKLFMFSHASTPPQECFVCLAIVIGIQAYFWRPFPMSCQTHLYVGLTILRAGK